MSGYSQIKLIILLFYKFFIFFICYYIHSLKTENFLNFFKAKSKCFKALNFEHKIELIGSLTPVIWCAVLLSNTLLQYRYIFVKKGCFRHHHTSYQKSLVHCEWRRSCWSPLCSKCFNDSIFSLYLQLLQKSLWRIRTLPAIAPI